MDVQGVSLSTASSMDVQIVLSLSTASSMDVQGVSQSIACSVDVQVFVLNRVTLFVMFFFFFF
jgi:hypothetical protein